MNKYLKCNVWRLAVWYDIYIYLYIYVVRSQRVNYVSSSCLILNLTYRIYYLLKTLFRVYRNVTHTWSSVTWCQWHILRDHVFAEASQDLFSPVIFHRWFIEPHTKLIRCCTMSMDYRTAVNRYRQWQRCLMRLFGKYWTLCDYWCLVLLVARGL